MAEQNADAFNRLIAAGLPEEQARVLAPDLAELSRSMRQARERLSLELEPASIYQAERR